jgi:hypothetical protein
VLTPRCGGENGVRADDGRFDATGLQSVLQEAVDVGVTNTTCRALPARLCALGGRLRDTPELSAGAGCRSRRSRDVDYPRCVSDSPEARPANLHPAAAAASSASAHITTPAVLQISASEAVSVTATDSVVPLIQVASAAVYPSGGGSQVVMTPRPDSPLPGVDVSLAENAWDLATLGTVCAEIGEFDRFEHPDSLSAYLGIVPSENTTGERRRQGSITKAGSTHARRLLIEASYHYQRHPAIGRTLERRQRGQSPDIVNIAWRAQRRLNARWRTLKHVSGLRVLARIAPIQPPRSTVVPVRPLKNPRPPSAPQPTRVLARLIRTPTAATAGRGRDVP